MVQPLPNEPALPDFPCSSWYFELQPSAYRLGMQLVMLLLAAWIVNQTLSPNLTLLTLVGLMSIAYYARQRRSLYRLALLDQSIWSLQYIDKRSKLKNHQRRQSNSRDINHSEQDIQRARLIRVTVIGVFCFLKFEPLQLSSSTEKRFLSRWWPTNQIEICIARDQVSVSQWLKLMQLAQFHS